MYGITYLNDAKTGKYQPKSLNWLETKVYSNDFNYKMIYTVF